MAQNFIFRKRVNGVVDTFYPKTATSNVVRETKDGEKKLDDILDEKGSFMQYSEKAAEESGKNDLLFEVLGDVIDSESIQSMKGTIVSDTPPEDTQYMWVDNSSETAILRVYDSESDSWKSVNFNSDQIELEGDIEE